jgi:tRNA (guanine37-N1)-methyltransferase
MRSYAVIARRADGERVRKRLRDAGLLRPDLRVHRSGETIEIPVRSLPDPPIDGTTNSEAEFSAASPAPPTSYVELVDIPEPERAGLPRAFDVVGDVVLIRIPPELGARAPAIGAALLRFVPGARVVAADRGVHGTGRVRRLQRIAGDGGYRTEHRENGLTFVVDLERAYFSPRLGREHARVAALARPGETVLDLCCGIGPFGLTIARLGAPRRVVLVDSNPEAIRLVRENASALGVEGCVQVVEEDLEAFLPDAPVSERVVLNLPHEGIKYLAQVVGAVARGGTLHYYEIMERSGRPERLADLGSSLPPRGEWTIGDSHVVHPYSPESDLVAVTLCRTLE